MIQERTNFQINDKDFEEYKRTVKEMERLILAAERSYKKIEQIRSYSVAGHSNTKGVGWIRIRNANKLSTK